MRNKRTTHDRGVNPHDHDHDHLALRTPQPPPHSPSRPPSHAPSRPPSRPLLPESLKPELVQNICSREDLEKLFGTAEVQEDDRQKDPSDAQRGAINKLNECIAVDSWLLYRSTKTIKGLLGVHSLLAKKYVKSLWKDKAFAELGSESWICIDVDDFWTEPSIQNGNADGYTFMSILALYLQKMESEVWTLETTLVLRVHSSDLSRKSEDESHDDLWGPEGMLRSLITQMLQRGGVELKPHDGLTCEQVPLSAMLNFASDNIDAIAEQHQRGSNQGLCNLFEWLLYRQTALNPGIEVVCIIEDMPRLKQSVPEDQQGAIHAIMEYLKTLSQDDHFRGKFKLVLIYFAKDESLIEPLSSISPAQSETYKVRRASKA